MAVYGPHYLNPRKIPRHVAMIMDGNGRWAQSHGKNRIWGHNHGVSTVKRVVRFSKTLGVEYLTLYAFSEENWNRPTEEINFIFSLIGRYLEGELGELNKQGVCLEFIGDFSRLSPEVKAQLDHAYETLASNKGLKLIIAISYGSRSEIVAACRSLASEVSEKRLRPDDIDQEIFRNFLQTSSYPDPDLLIRTSGELRISNFLLWQLAYTELYFSPKMWPEFESLHYLEAVYQYQLRKRRFGSLASQ